MNRLLVVVPYFLLAIVIFRASCPAAIIPYDPNTMSYPVSVEQAKASARAWADDPNLTLVLKGIRINLITTGDPHRFFLVTEDGNQQFMVDCCDAQITFWCNVPAENAYRAKIDENWDTSPQLPVTQRKNAVVQFLSVKFPNFTSLNMQPSSPDSTNPAYYEVLAGNVWHLANSAFCFIDEWTGEIYSYFGGYKPPPSISIVPLVTAAEAEQIALDYVGTLQMWDWGENANAYLTNPQSAFVLENEGLVVRTDYVTERLSWDVMVHVHAMDFYTPAHYQYEIEYEHGLSSGELLEVYVDAHTGEVYYCEPGGPLGASPKLKAASSKTKSRKPNPSALKSQPPFEKGELYLNDLQWSDLMYPPLAVGNVGYLYAKYLPILYGGTITWNSGVADMQVAGRKVKLRPRAEVMEVDGKEIRLAIPPMIIAGRAYVPYEAVEHICGAKASWDAKEKRLSIISGNIPLKPQFRRPEKM